MRFDLVLLSGMLSSALFFTRQVAGQQEGQARSSTRELRLELPELAFSAQAVLLRFLVPQELQALFGSRSAALVDGRGEPLALLQIERVLGSPSMSPQEPAPWQASVVLPVLGGLAPDSLRLLPCTRPTARFAFDMQAGMRTIAVDGVVRLRHVRLYDPARHHASFKHFDAVLGRHGELLTKGVGGGVSHHRGIFAGWNRVRHGQQSYDFWHGNKGESLRFVADEKASEYRGPVCARRVLHAAWCAPDGKVIVQEKRTLDIWAPEAGRLVVDVTLELRSPKGSVELDGDPQHGGLQIRLANEVADHETQTRYLRDARAQGGKNDVWSSCDWALIVCRIGKQRWGIMHSTLEMPAAHVYSTRAYGRFGSFCKTRLEAGQAQRFRVRFQFFDLARCRVDQQRAEQLHALAMKPPLVKISAVR